jgi:hypothetical protein
MVDQEEGFGDFFSSFTEGMKPGSKIYDFGLLRYRQGAHSRNWALPGAVNYLPGDYQILAGCQKWTGAAAASGGFEVTYPTPFAENPIILLTVTNTTPLFERAVVQATNQSSSVCEVYWWSDNNLTRIDVYWFALGPISL